MRRKHGEQYFTPKNYADREDFLCHKDTKLTKAFFVLLWCSLIAASPCYVFQAFLRDTP